MTPAEVLRKAADVIRERGWCQYAYTNEKGACCLFGAVDAVDFTDEAGAIRFLREAVTGHLVAAWNDEPGRTKEEVLLVLEQAAKLAEVEHGV